MKVLELRSREVRSCLRGASLCPWSLVPIGTLRVFAWRKIVIEVQPVGRVSSLLYFFFRNFPANGKLIAIVHDTLFLFWRLDASTSRQIVIRRWTSRTPKALEARSFYIPNSNGGITVGNPRNYLTPPASGLGRVRMTTRFWISAKLDRGPWLVDSWHRQPVLNPRSLLVWKSKLNSPATGEMGAQRFVGFRLSILYQCINTNPAWKNSFKLRFANFRVAAFWHKILAAIFSTVSQRLHGLRENPTSSEDLRIRNCHQEETNLFQTLGSPRLSFCMANRDGIRFGWSLNV